MSNNYYEIISALQEFAITNSIAISSQPNNFKGIVNAINAMSEGVQTTLTTKADLVEGKLSVSQVPDISITDYKGAVADEAAMLAITGEKGDWVVRNDDNKVYIITGSDPSSASDWVALSYPGNSVTSVAGKTGAVTLSHDDIGSGAITASTGSFSGSATFSSRVDANKFRSLSSGSASAPTICPGYDNDTGLYHPATNTIGITTAGSEKVRIESGGNVGIGTSSPNAKLTVMGLIHQGAGAFGANVSYGGRSIQANIDINSTSLRGGVLVRNANDFRSLTDSASFMHYDAYTNSATSYAFRASKAFSGTTLVDTFWVKSSGEGYFKDKVGIGTTSPTQKLDVNGTIEANDLTINGSSFRNIPKNSKTAAYTLLVSDLGKVVCITTGGVTIPAGVFSSGDAVTIYNDSGSDQTITPGFNDSTNSNVTLRTAGTSTDGNKTLAGYGLCTVLCVASNVFVVGGAGLS